MNSNPPDLRRLHEYREFAFAQIVDCQRRPWHIVLAAAVGPVLGEDHPEIVVVLPVPHLLFCLMGTMGLQ